MQLDFTRVNYEKYNCDDNNDDTMTMTMTTTTEQQWQRHGASLRVGYLFLRCSSNRANERNIRRVYS